MNPFTRSLLEKIKDPQLTQFAFDWGELEALIIEVFRNKEASPQDQLHHQRTRTSLLEAYARYEEGLRPYWQATRIRGKQRGEFESTAEDPFLELLAHQNAGEFTNNRRTFIVLPAAREALNAYLLSKTT